jgi:methionyl-tRNA formyltransferase
MIRTVVFGKSTLACSIAEYFLTSADHELIGVVPSPRTAPVFASLADFAGAHGIPVLDLAAVDRGLGVDLGFSCFFSEIFRRPHIDAIGRLVNLHNAPLPRYRGMRPINWALLNSESSHGVTIHEIDEGVDTGAIISQCTFPVFPGDEVIDLYLRAQRFGWQLFVETAPRLMDLPAVPQDDAQATLYRGVDSARLGEREGFTRSGSMDGYPLPL